MTPSCLWTPFALPPVVVFRMPPLLPPVMLPLACTRLPPAVGRFVPLPVDVPGFFPVFPLPEVPLLDGLLSVIDGDGF